MLSSVAGWTVGEGRGGSAGDSGRTEVGGGGNSVASKFILGGSAGFSISSRSKPDGTSGISAGNSVNRSGVVSKSPAKDR